MIENGNILDCNGNCITDLDNDLICDQIDECVGEYDECGVCNGNGIPVDECDCYGHILDCADVCGGTSIEDCVCSEGYYENESGDCVECPIGSYRTNMGSILESECTICDDIKTTIGTGSKSESDCVCKEGYGNQIFEPTVLTTETYDAAQIDSSDTNLIL